MRSIQTHSAVSIGFRQYGPADSVGDLYCGLRPTTLVNHYIFKRPFMIQTLSVVIWTRLWLPRPKRDGEGPMWSVDECSVDELAK